MDGGDDGVNGMQRCLWVSTLGEDVGCVDRLMCIVNVESLQNDFTIKSQHTSW